MKVWPPPKAAPDVLPAASATAAGFTSRRTVPSPDRGAIVTSTVDGLETTSAAMAPLRPPPNTGAKSEASAPFTGSLNATRNVMLVPLLDAAAGFRRLTERTVGAAVSTITGKAADAKLAPAPRDATARNE